MSSPRFFARVLKFSAAVARNRVWSPLAPPMMRVFARVTMRKRQAAPQTGLPALAAEWQRMFPLGAKDHPIVEERDGVVYARIETNCPLRGTGDRQACHRLMEYDRTMVRSMGGQFEVVESQSDSGKPFCLVALRLADK